MRASLPQTNRGAVPAATGRHTPAGTWRRLQAWQATRQERRALRPTWRLCCCGAMHRPEVRPEGWGMWCPLLGRWIPGGQLPADTPETRRVTVPRTPWL